MLDKFFRPATVKANIKGYLISMFVCVVVLGTLLPFVPANGLILLPIGVLTIGAAFLFAAVDIALSSDE